MDENNRIKVEDLLSHPFIEPNFLNKSLTELDIPRFEKDMKTNKHFSGFSSLYSAPTMPERFDDTRIEATDVILTTKLSDQKPLLVK